MGNDINECIDNWFTYHAPSQEQIPKYGELRQAGKTLAETIVRLCPMGADTMDAVRKVREAIMTANAAIACNGE